MAVTAATAITPSNGLSERRMEEVALAVLALAPSLVEGLQLMAHAATVATPAALIGGHCACVAASLQVLLLLRRLSSDRQLADWCLTLEACLRLLPRLAPQCIARPNVRLDVPSQGPEDLASATLRLCVCIAPAAGYMAAANADPSRQFPIPKAAEAAWRLHAAACRFTQWCAAEREACAALSRLAARHGGVQTSMSGALLTPSILVSIARDEALNHGDRSAAGVQQR